MLHQNCGGNSLDSADVDDDMDTSSFIDLDEHVDSLVFDTNDIFFSDDEGSIDLDGSYDPPRG